jgi:hypothetical protein
MTTRQAMLTSCAPGLSTSPRVMSTVLSRSANSAPNTVEVAAIQVTHARLLTQVVVAPPATGCQAMMPRP